MMEDFSIPETSDGGSYPWQRVGRFEIRLSWKSSGRRSSRSTFNFLFNTTRRARATPLTSYHVHRARRGARARAPHPRTYPGQSGTVLGDFGASEAASPSPEGFRTAGHKKGTLPRSSIIHDQGSLGICRLRKGGRECAYLSRIDRIDSKTSWLVHVAGCRPLQE